MAKSNPDLESARGKLNRAREHIAAFHGIDAFLRRDEALPLDFRIEEDVERPNRISVVVSEIIQANPLRSYILGDALQNFRSTLDHIAWQVVQRGSAVPLKPGQETKIQFPICSTLSEFNARVGTQLRGISPVHETVIRSHQPFRRGRLAIDHPLAILASFSNIDKHREINPLLVASAEYRVRAFGDPAAGCTVLRVVEGPDLRRPLRVGATLAYVDLSDKATCLGRLQVETEGTLHLAVREGLWLNDAIAYIDAEVSDVLTEIERVV